MAEMKTFNGYEVVDAKARQDIATLNEKEPDLSNYYTKAQTDSAIGEAVSGIKIPEVDISGKADLVHQHSMADITDYVAPDLSEYAKKTDIPVIPDIPSLDNVATKEYVDTADKKHTQDIANLTHHIQNIIEPTIVQKSDKGHKHTLSEITDYTAPDMSNYYTKAQVDALFNGIATAEGGSY